MPIKRSAVGKHKRKGAKPGNKNGQTHGASAQLNIRKIDARTREGKTLLGAKGSLVSAIGGDPSPQQSILIDRVVFKMLRCLLYERAVLAGKASAGTDHIYLAWANSLRLDLQALGLKRETKRVLDLQNYLKTATDTSPDQ